MRANSPTGRRIRGPDHRAGNGAAPADEGDEGELEGEVQPEDLLGIEIQGELGQEGSGQCGQEAAQCHGPHLVLCDIHTQGLGRFGFLPACGEIIAGPDPRDVPGDEQYDDEHDQDDVVVGDLAHELVGREIVARDQGDADSPGSVDDATGPTFMVFSTSTLTPSPKAMVDRAK